MTNKKQVLKTFVLSILLSFTILGCGDSTTTIKDTTSCGGNPSCDSTSCANSCTGSTVTSSSAGVTGETSSASAFVHKYGDTKCSHYSCPVTGAIGSRPRTGICSESVSTVDISTGPVCPKLIHKLFGGTVDSAVATTYCPIDDRKGIFTLGRIPFSNPTVMVKAHKPVLDGIAAALCKKAVYLVTAPDYEGVIKLLVDKKIDAAWVGTGDYVKASLAGIPLEPLVTPVRKGSYFYQGAIICRKDKGFKTLSDLKGKSVAFVDPASASGYIFPKALFELNGFKIPADIISREPGKVDFLRKHDTVAIAVYLGKYDAGAVYNNAIDNVFRNEPEKLKEMQVLALTDKIISEPIIVRGDMDPVEKQNIKDAFLSLSFDMEKMPAELGGLEGFKAVSPDMYKDVIKALGRK